MASTDDPPYLTVGTEVSAKYRGAFCEATIKIAKKLVKCKVSYGKGQSALVTSDSIKGHLKVGGQVEVKQPDGHFQQANIVKLTDHSTYTVVFDDGDERTLKRSSLCLKGGRHFHESESLDHLPLTDPENFGTPVMNSTSKNTGRKRRRGSHSPSSSPAKRRCTYPSEFPVGKAVFLVNDRRRSSWLPAVIVPAHYVLEASEMEPDTICLRSFKDGRYFAATKKELHEFSPDKEPLQSMLEGEIPAMYMCKPAIERAMAYIDTGELPWDMDLLDNKSVRPTPSHPLASDPSTSDDDDQQKTRDELLLAEFEDSFKKFHESRGSVHHRQPTLGPHDLNLFQLYRLVKSNGGMDKVTQEMKWRSLYLQLGLPLNSTGSQALRQAYRKYLHQFELYENKLKSGSGGLGRHKPRPPSSDEDQDTSTTTTQQDQSNRTRQQDKLTPQKHKLKQQDKLKRQDKVSEDKGSHGKEGEGGKGKVNGVEKAPKKVDHRTTPAGKGALADRTAPAGKGALAADKTAPAGKGGLAEHRTTPAGKGALAEHRTTPAGKGALAEHRTTPAGKNIKTMKTVKMEKIQYKQLMVKQESMEAEEEGVKSDSKSEGESSDVEHGPTESNSWHGEDMAMELDRSASLSHLQERGGWEQCPGGYQVNDRVLVFYGKGKTLLKYEAKVVEVEAGEDKSDYLVHYNGWNTRYDEWIDSSRIAGKLTGSQSGKTTFFHRKRKKLPPPPPKSHSITSLQSQPPVPPTYSSTKLVLSPSPSSFKVTGSPSSPAKLLLTPPLAPPTSSSSSSSSSPSSVSKLVLSPSLQAIISGHTTQQHTKTSKDKAYDSISGRDISSRPPLSLKAPVPAPPPKPTLPASRVPVRRTPRLRGLKPGGPRSKDTLDMLNSSHTLDGQSDVGGSASNSSSAPTSPTTPSNKDFLSPVAPPSSERDEQPITVKQEENQLWSAVPSPPPATPPPNSASPSSVVPTVTSSDDLPGASPKAPLLPSSPSALSLAEPAAQSLLSLSTATFPPILQAASTTHFPGSSTPKSPSDCPLGQGPPSALSPKGGKEGVDNMEASGSEVESLPGTLDCTERKSLDSASGSDKEDSPAPRQRTGKTCQSSSPDSKRKWRTESNEEYERRKKVRHADMVYTLDFSQLPPMSGVDRVVLIQDRLKEVQKHWTDLKAEVAYIERKRRRARRKEREAAQSAAHQTPAPPPSSCPPSDSSPPHKSEPAAAAAIPCH